jgi:hypothetical protein
MRLTRMVEIFYDSPSTDEQDTILKFTSTIPSEQHGMPDILSSTAYFAQGSLAITNPNKAICALVLSLMGCFRLNH